MVPPEARPLSMLLLQCSTFSEQTMTQATPYRDYSSAAGFDHPYGDYTETVADGSGNFYSIWGEGESYTGSGDAYYAKD